MDEIWREPVRGGFMDPALNALPGMERVQALYRGLTPRSPLSHLIGIVPTQLGVGSVTVSMPTSPWLTGFARWIEPSLVIEPTITLAVGTTLPAGRTVTATVLSVSYARVATPETGSIVVRARVLHTRRSVATAEAVAEDPQGRLIAHATGIVRTPEVEISTDARPALAPFEEPVYATPDPYLRRLPREVRVPDIPLDRSFLELAREQAAAPIPGGPARVFFGARQLDVGEGRVSMAMPATEWLCTSLRQVSHGAIAFMMSGVLSSANFTILAAGRMLGVLDLNVRFLRSVTPDGRDMIGRATNVFRSDDLLVATAELFDADGIQVALATQTAVPLAMRAPARATASERSLATVVFTDICDSTAHAERLGDERWAALLEEHHRIVRKEIANFKGREVKTTGDGFLATFDSPARAIQCARAVREGIRRLGVEISTGVHTGEVELMGADVGGIAVHIASRVLDAAGPGEILVSSTLKDAVTGSGIPFEDRGSQTLKGVPGEWRLYAVAG